MDNEALISVLNRLYSRHSRIRKLLKPITFLCLSHNIHITTVHIAGSSNVGPDLLSRGRIREFKARFPSADPQPDILPDHLSPTILED
jgi:hypothetical protein